jgi:hypothetical protein
MTTTITTNQLDLARQFIENTGKNLFLTGKAGTGKTTFLRELKKNSPKRMVVVAPTGVAAINAGGVTVHSFFQLPFGPQIPNHYLPDSQKKGELSIHLSREKLNIMRSMDLLVIDEISMVRADLLDAIDGVLRRVRRRAQPFGGVQVLMIGDLQQLAPVVKDDDWNILKSYYAGPFFFQSKVLEKYPAETIELNTIFRQKDANFIDLLNQIRENRLTADGLRILNSRYNQAFQQATGYITLTSHNRQAQYINEQKLQAIPFKPVTFKAVIDGEFPEFAYPNETQLALKKGAQVMFIKNDNSRAKLYYNGKIGVVESIEGNLVMVRCDDLDDAIAVGPAEWQNFKFTLNPTTSEIEESITGTFTQHPLKLAWAITIHKSQGLTFEKAIIDANAAFAHGQVYVALSRCRTLEGLVLSSPIDEKGIISSTSVNNFIIEAGANAPTPERIRDFQIEYEQELILDLFDFSQLGRQLSHLQKEIDENRTVLFGAFPDRFNAIQGEFKEAVANVSGKFKQQLQQLFTCRGPVAGNAPLQERIRKGCIYFQEKLDALVKPITTEIELETDNKAIRKTIVEQLERIARSYNTHHMCLKTCAKGFAIGSYLSAKSISNIEKEAVKPKIVKEGKPFTASSNPDLYNLLRKWRNNMADEHNLPVYMIVTTKALIDMTDKMPSTIKELLKINGMGKRKTEQFGKDLLELIQEYRTDKGLEKQTIDFTTEPETVKEIKIKTWQESLNLHKLGLSFEAIAEKRGMVKSTIEGHMAKAIDAGAIELEAVMDKKRIKTIEAWLDKNPSNAMVTYNTSMGSGYSFGELKMVLVARKMKKGTD